MNALLTIEIHSDSLLQIYQFTCLDRQLFILLAILFFFGSLFLQFP
jgi:hypothetical protein